MRGSARLNCKWQGEPVNVYFGSCTVSADKGKPLMWYNFECLQFSMDGFYNFPAILIEYGKEHFVLANHFGVGIAKLLAGGWPEHRHFSLPTDKFKQNDDYIITEFKRDDFEEHELDRKAWQKENYPEEYAKLQQLINAGRNIANQLPNFKKE